MTFIATIAEGSAEGDVAAMYARARDSFGYVPNMARAFSHRPEVMAAWNTLIASIRKNMDQRRYELVTLAAARELRSSYCMLAHAKVLLGGHYDAADLKVIVTTPEESSLDETDKAIVRFASKVVRDATSIGVADFDALRRRGLTDPEIFDIASAAAVRCFFSKTLDAVGALPDSAYQDMEQELRESLVVGRPIAP